MVAGPPSVVSDRPPGVPQRVGLGDRFHYFRGYSGRRYLFSLIEADALGDFRSAVAMLARPHENGRIAAHTIAVLDPSGRAVGVRRRLSPSPDDLVLVHLLAATDAERWDLVSDLVPEPLALAA